MSMLPWTLGSASARSDFGRHGTNSGDGFGPKQLEDTILVDRNTLPGCVDECQGWNSESWTWLQALLQGGSANYDTISQWLPGAVPCHRESVTRNPDSDEGHRDALINLGNNGAAAAHLSRLKKAKETLSLASQLRLVKLIVATIAQSRDPGQAQYATVSPKDLVLDGNASGRAAKSCNPDPAAAFLQGNLQAGAVPTCQTPFGHDSYPAACHAFNVTRKCKCKSCLKNIHQCPHPSSSIQISRAVQDTPLKDSDSVLNSTITSNGLRSSTDHNPDEAALSRRFLQAGAIQSETFGHNSYPAGHAYAYNVGSKVVQDLTHPAQGHWQVRGQSEEATLMPSAQLVNSDLTRMAGAPVQLGASVKDLDPVVLDSTSNGLGRSADYNPNQAVLSQRYLQARTVPTCQTQAFMHYSDHGDLDHAFDFDTREAIWQNPGTQSQKIYYYREDYCMSHSEASSESQLINSNSNVTTTWAPDGCDLSHASNVGSSEAIWQNPGTNSQEICYFDEDYVSDSEAMPSSQIANSYLNFMATWAPAQLEALGDALGPEYQGHGYNDAINTQVEYRTNSDVASELKQQLRLLDNQLREQWVCDYTTGLWN